MFFTIINFHIKNNKFLYKLIKLNFNLISTTKKRKMLINAYNDLATSA